MAELSPSGGSWSHPGSSGEGGHRVLGGRVGGRGVHVALARDPARGHAARRHLQTLHRHQPLHLRSQVGYCQRPRHLITSLLKKQVFWWIDTTFGEAQSGGLRYKRQVVCIDA